MVTSVKVRGSVGWHDIHANDAPVPGSVNALKGDGAFADIIGGTNPATSRYIRNAANTDWLSLDKIINYPDLYVANAASAQDFGVSVTSTGEVGDWLLAAAVAYGGSINTPSGFLRFSSTLNASMIMRCFWKIATVASEEVGFSGATNGMSAIVGRYRHVDPVEPLEENERDDIPYPGSMSVPSVLGIPFFRGSLVLSALEGQTSSYQVTGYNERVAIAQDGFAPYMGLFTNDYPTETETGIIECVNGSGKLIEMHACNFVSNGV